MAKNTEKCKCNNNKDLVKCTHGVDTCNCTQTEDKCTSCGKPLNLNKDSYVIMGGIKCCDCNRKEVRAIWERVDREECGTHLEINRPPLKSHLSREK